MTYPTPHLEKLNALLQNDKLPNADIERVNQTLERYHSWIAELEECLNGRSPQDILQRMVTALTNYRNYIDIELIFDSSEDFLYRQKGQLKLDNSVIEEFIPHLIHQNVIAEIENLPVSIGPRKTFSSAYFQSSLNNQVNGGGLSIRTKDQDFAITKRIYLKSSYERDFAVFQETSLNIAYFAAECKTNLDKTMFQEACATAHDVKTAVSGAKYFLLCEWLDMTPISTASTDIDEVIILRKAKRVNSNIRRNFGTYRGRQASREGYVAYLQANPFSVDMFERFIDYIVGLINDVAPEEASVLQTGYF